MITIFKHYKLMVSKTIKCLAIFPIGYLLVILFTCCDEEWVNASTGEREKRLKIFPFEYKRKTITAFDKLYGRYATGTSKDHWLFVDRKKLIPIYEIESITEGQYHVRAEVMLVQVDFTDPFGSNQRRLIANDFFDALSKSGPSGAYRYAREIYFK
jgi:hypothetical protein